MAKCALRRGIFLAWALPEQCFAMQAIHANHVQLSACYSTVGRLPPAGPRPETMRTMRINSRRSIHERSENRRMTRRMKMTPIRRPLRHGVVSFLEIRMFQYFWSDRAIGSFAIVYLGRGSADSQSVSAIRPRFSRRGGRAPCRRSGSLDQLRRPFARNSAVHGRVDPQNRKTESFLYRYAPFVS